MSVLSKLNVLDVTVPDVLKGKLTDDLGHY